MLRTWIRWAVSLALVATAFFGPSPEAQAQVQLEPSTADETEAVEATYPDATPAWYVRSERARRRQVTSTQWLASGTMAAFGAMMVGFGEWVGSAPPDASVGGTSLSVFAVGALGYGSWLAVTTPLAPMRDDAPERPSRLLGYAGATLVVASGLGLALARDAVDPDVFLLGGLPASMLLLFAQTGVNDLAVVRALAGGPDPHDLAPPTSVQYLPYLMISALAIIASGAVNEHFGPLQQGAVGFTAAMFGWSVLWPVAQARVARHQGLDVSAGSLWVLPVLAAGVLAPAGFAASAAAGLTGAAVVSGVLAGRLMRAIAVENAHRFWGESTETASRVEWSIGPAPVAGAGLALTVRF